MDLGLWPFLLTLNLTFGAPPAPRTRRKAPGAKAGCVSLRQVSLHKQRKVARAVRARKLLMLMLPSSKMEKIRSSSLRSPPSSGAARHLLPQAGEGLPHPAGGRRAGSRWLAVLRLERSEEHTSELQSLMRNSYAVFCL